MIVLDGIFTQLSANEVREKWDKIFPLLARAIEKNGLRWTPLDVYERAIVNECSIWATDETDAIIVFTVNTGPEGRELFIWVASSQSETTMSEFWEDVQRIKELHGCDYVGWYSSREWMRAIPNLERVYYYTERSNGR